MSARQMMDWQDGRSQTDILYQRWDGESLQFTIAADERTSDMLTTMLPTSLENAYLVSLTRDDVPVPFDTEIVKGVSYDLFPGLDGEYRAIYGTENICLERKLTRSKQSSEIRMRRRYCRQAWLPNEKSRAALAARLFSLGVERS